MKNDILTLLKTDHEKVASLFERLEQTKAGEARHRLYLELKNELFNHTQAEEEAVYSAFGVKKHLQDFGKEGTVEHSLVRYLITELDGTPLDDDKWEPRIKVLKDLVEHHVQEEEELFGEIRSAISAKQREAMAAEFLTVKEGSIAKLKGFAA
jgi:hemerythrin superfamily protein